MYLEYYPISCCFFSPHVVFALEAFVHLCAAAKNVLFLVHKVIRNRSIWGPCRFLIFVTKHLVKNIPIYLSGNMKESIWEKSGKVKNLYGNAKDFEKQNEKHMEKWWIWLKKWKNLYGKNIEMWRICMEVWRMFKEKWKIYGKMTNSSGKVKERSNGILSIGVLTSNVF